MNIRWWQSLRWRLALGSVFLVLLTMSSLALAAILVINNYYHGEQKKNLSQFASYEALRIKDEMELNPAMTLQAATRRVFGTTPKFDGQPLLVIVFNKSEIPVYPEFRTPSPPPASKLPNLRSPTLASQPPQVTATARSVATAQARATTTAEAKRPKHTPTPPQATATARASATTRATVTAKATATAMAKATATLRDSRRVVLEAALQLINPSLQKNDFTLFNSAIGNALFAHPPIATDDEFGRDSPVSTAQPFSVQPITDGTRLFGALVITVQYSASDRTPAFVAAVGKAVVVASLAITILAAIAVIFFSQTITRPLMKLTNAARTMSSGNYNVQVREEAPGELGELAHTFNEMTAQLHRDMEELRRQELWRRELIMSITHDLATPLTAITGLGEALVDGVNQSREDYEATGRIIVRETLRLRRLVKDLHMMAKMEAGALQPQYKAVRLAALVDEVLAVLAPEFERAQVEPINAISYNLPMVQADPDMLTRVFSNLCDNALRHTPPGGTVVIEATRQKNQLRISVTDTGEGIPEEALTRVFERFFRADNARQSTKGGSGLGLAIVQAIVEAHGGTVQAENVQGAGACIAFTLPVDEQAPSPVDETTLRLPQKGMRRLVERSIHLQRTRGQ